jgi:Predicted tRNA(5-methylaminomethyl-2-thiouridylate) methyltransferase, contains the PP-loop ATPase domain
LDSSPRTGEELGVRLRYRMQPAACCARWEAGGARLRFGTPQLPAAPGQVAAFYAGEELLGGGIIARSA